MKIQVPQHYIKVPKEVILSTDINEHRILTLIYMNYNQTWCETVNYSPFHMITWCGYKPSWNRGRKDNIYTKFRDCMEWYFKNGYLVDFDVDKYTLNNFQSSLLNKEKILPKDNFALLYDFEIKAIMDYKSQYKPLNKSIVLLLLAYIRAFTWVRKTEPTGHSEKSRRSKPEIFHSKFDTMSQYTGISPRMISKATDVLNDLGIVKTYRMPSYQDKDGKWYSDDVIFICPYKIIANKNQIRFCTKEEYDWEKELQYGIKYLSSNHAKKKFNQN